MEHHTTTSRAEAERLLGIAEKLLRTKDFSGCRDFAILAQETEPLLEGSDQILAVAEVLHAADNKRLSATQPDWYSILQVPPRSDEELIRKQYRRFALLLHPDKNRFPFSDSAFRLVADSWAVLSDPVKKSVFDNEFAARFAKVDLGAMKKQNQFNQRKGEENSNSHQKLPVRRSARGDGASGGADDASGGGIRVNRRTGGGSSGWIGNFWTACPYCYNLYEYPRQYEGCCLRCDNEKCRRAFTGTEILSMPPVVPGKEAYYCCWGFFPMGFVSGNTAGFPKWMPPMFEEEVAAAPIPPSAAPIPPPAAPIPASAPPRAENVTPVNVTMGASSEKRKRGRPRKKF